MRTAPLMKPLLPMLLLLPSAALAHGAAAGVGDFYAGAFDLVGDPIDVFAWLSLAALAGLHAARIAGWTSELFAAGLLTGLLGARVSHAAAMPLLADASPLLLVGALIARGRPLPLYALYPLALAIGGVRGWHYGADTMARSDLLSLAGGLTLAGYLLVSCTLAFVLWFIGNHGDRTGRAWQVVTIRAFGSWICAVALMVAGFSLRHVSL